MDQASSILIFHLLRVGKLVEHAASYTVFLDDWLSPDQIAVVAANDRKMLTSGALIEFVGSVPGSFALYEDVRATDEIGRYCPKCNPIMKGKEDE